ncbi:protein kinase [Plantactinospora sonchi]|uniref:non-specific serine/threonine protein kinase n=1 Tax=Plantactinospora sonchi TaxID=1544735 RepID=A0ABU7RPR3_9ACTN
MLSPGVVLNDRYLLNDRVATGGMGEVWSATDTLLRRRVAVKVLLPALISDTEFITRFRTEARLMAALRHPGIVQVYDYGENAPVDGGHRVDYLVMEYLEGVPLSKRIKAAGRLGVAETLSVVAQAAQALHVAHQASIVHRDVKPSNLLVQPDGSIVLVDFGVARSANITGITGSNVVLGTAHYMAPEQISGRPVSAATDIYALGALAYCCLTGRPPFTGTNPLHVVSQHLQDPPPALPPDVPAPVAALVTHALAKDPAHRHPSAAAFAEAARALLATPPATVATPLSGTPWSTGTAPAADRAGHHQTPLPYGAPPPSASGSGYDGGTEQPSGAPPTVPDQRWNAAPPAGDGNRRRRNRVLAAVAGTLAVALAGLGAVLVLRPGAQDPSASDLLTRVGGRASTSATPSGGGLEPAARATSQPNRSAGTTGGATATPTPSRPGGSAPTGGPKPTPSRTSPSTKNPYTAAEACGSGYQVIDSATLTGSDGGVQGRVYLLYNAGNGYNCAVTLKTTSVGSRTPVSTYLEVQGQARSTDSGSFDYYAGPVRAKAAGVCVRWGGSAAGVGYNSPFEHCD